VKTYLSYSSRKSSYSIFSLTLACFLLLLSILKSLIPSVYHRAKCVVVNIYMHLKKSYTIFICTEDVFGQKRYQYTFRNLCLEDKALELNDGATKIFFNTTCSHIIISQQQISYRKPFVQLNARTVLI